MKPGIIVFGIFVLVIGFVPVRAKEWRGLVPMKSKCQDAKRILGIRNCKSDHFYSLNGDQFRIGVIAVLCATSESLAQSAPGFARFKRVHYIRSETRRDIALEKAILRSLPSYREEIRRIREYDLSVVPTYLVRYFYNRVDLNDDGRSETLVWLHSAMVGGSSGYTAQIYRSGKEGYRLLWQGTPAWNPVIVSGRKTRGWRNLIMLVAGGGVRPGYWIEARFAGQSYPSSPRDGVEIKKSRIAGRAFIADNWWSGFKGIELRPPELGLKLRATFNRQHNKALQLTGR